MEARLAERGLVLRAAFENEFSLATREDGAVRPDRLRPLLLDDRDDRLAGLRRRAGGRARARRASRSSSTTPSSATASRRSRPAHAPALRAADEQLLVRETIRGVAARHGLVASLAPKPWPDNAGNGAHIHFSLWDGERNRFYDGSAPDGLSADARSFIAGVLAHLPGLCGLTAPSFNSYHRIVPQYWAGAFTCWGYDNREAPVRVASSFAGVGGGLDERRAEGVRRELQPVPRARRADRGRAGRDRARARAAGAGRGRSGDDRRATSAPRAGSSGCRRPRQRRSTRSRPTSC